MNTYAYPPRPKKSEQVYIEVKNLMTYGNHLQ